MATSNNLSGINVDLNRVPTERCICGNNTWKIVFLIKKVSALVSPTGKDTVVPIQIFACDKCNTISPLFKNLNDTDEIESSKGESLRGGVKNEMPENPKPTDTAKLFVG